MNNSRLNLLGALLSVMTPAIVSQIDSKEQRDLNRDDFSHIDRAARRRVERQKRKQEKRSK